MKKLKNKIIKSKSMNKILNDRLYLDMVKFLGNNPITEDSQILIERYLSKQVDALLSESESDKENTQKI